MQPFWQCQNVVRLLGFFFCWFYCFLFCFVLLNILGKMWFSIDPKYTCSSLRRLIEKVFNLGNLQIRNIKKKKDVDYSINSLVLGVCAVTPADRSDQAIT